MDRIEEQTRSYQNLLRVIKPHPLFKHIPIKMLQESSRKAIEEQETR